MNSSEEAWITREPAVAGQFYPGQPALLQRELARLFSGITGEAHPNRILALISPHAGYHYSGAVAAAAFSQLDPESVYDQLFIIGSSHRYNFDGASVFTRGQYKTPLGIVPVNIQVSRQLISSSNFFSDRYEPQLYEHSLEVQLPFLQFRLKKPFQIVPIVIGTQHASTCREIAITLLPYLTSSSLFIISTDFSHYPDYENACRLDHLTTEAILTGDPDILLKSLDRNEHAGIPGLSTCLCGWTSVLTLLYMTRQLQDTAYTLIGYRNSGDAAGMADKSRVVGYCAMKVEQAATARQKPAEPAANEPTAADKRTLLKLARAAIRSRLTTGHQPGITPFSQTPALLQRAGVFVSLYKRGKLRGCIGRFTPDMPLFELVQEMAISAALHDHRFSPLNANEIQELKIEISILTPLQKIDAVEDIELGRHGIYIRKGHHTGTYLPQVALNTGWSKEEFVEHCASDKAGIGRNGWKDAELYVYEALIICDDPDNS